MHSHHRKWVRSPKVRPGVLHGAPSSGQTTKGHETRRRHRNMRAIQTAALAAALALVGCGVDQGTLSTDDGASTTADQAVKAPELKPDGRHEAIWQAHAAGGKRSGNGISYHGGPVMSGG